MSDMGNIGSSGNVASSVVKQVASSTTVSTTTKVRVVSYNVLSSHLANPQSYPTYNPNHLDSTYRLRNVLQKLEAEIKRSTNTSGSCSGTTRKSESNTAAVDEKDDRSTIFCLQEVSYDWAGQLHTFFANHQYHVVTGLYGQKFNGYMGVLTAYPVHQFKTVHVDISRLADTYPKPWPRPPKAPPPTTIEQVSTLVKNTFQYFGVLSKDKPEPEGHWNSAQRRYNVLLSVILAETNPTNHQQPEPPHQNEFVVSNYHMPCVYYNEKVMVLHSDLCLSRVQSISNQEVIPFRLPDDDAATTTNEPLLLSSSIPPTTVPTDTKNEAKVEGDAVTINVESGSNTPRDEQHPRENKKQRVEQRRPYILAGDFNIKPLDTAYILLTTGQISATDPAYPVPPVPVANNNGNMTAIWEPLQLEPVRSAYATFATETMVAATVSNSGSSTGDSSKRYHSSGTNEPDFTNFSQMGDTEKSRFIDTLDYIFVSPNNHRTDSNSDTTDDATTSSTAHKHQHSIDIKDVIPLQHRDDITDGPYPNAVEPSDHVMIGADLDISFSSFPK